MDRNDEDFDAWLTGQRDEFDAAVRERVDSAAVLRAIKHRSAQEARREIDQRVAVAATTGAPPEPQPAWPSDRWEHVDADFAKLAEQASLQTYAELLAAWHHKTVTITNCKLQRTRHADPEPDWQDYGFDDCELFTALSQGQRGALVRILSLVRPLAFRYTRAQLSVHGAPLELTDDLAQQALTRLVKELPTYEYREGQPFLQFVYLVLKKEVLRAKREYQKPSCSAFLPRGEDTIAAQIATQLAELPERQREVLLLRVVVGLSAEETATALGSNAGSVRVTQHRALTRLRRMILEAELPPATPRFES